MKKKPTPRQVARAWNGVKQEYGVRRNKAHTDGRQWEVYVDWGGPISDETVKVLARCANEQAAEDHADGLDDDARGKAVLALFA